jgi:hypothetical protein
MENINDINHAHNIIFSDIDDTLYTDIFMTKKIFNTHQIIKSLKPSHIIFISARPNILRYFTKMNLMKDFSKFTLLMGSLYSLIMYLFLYGIYLITSNIHILHMSQQIIGMEKIRQFDFYLKNNHMLILSETKTNHIYFFGDNIQGDEIFASYLMRHMNHIYEIDNKSYKISCMVSIRNVMDYI